jgi:hypothetical protein
MEGQERVSCATKRIEELLTEPNKYLSSPYHLTHGAGPFASIAGLVTWRKVVRNVRHFISYRRMRNSIAFLDGFKASPARPSDNISMEMKTVEL